MENFFSIQFDDDPQIDLGKNRKKRKPAKENKRETATLDDLTTKIPKECDYGNREYKLQLLNISQERLEGLTSQMKFRLAEGQGTAFYMLGFTDDGHPQGLHEEDFKESLENLHRMAEKIRARIIVLRHEQVQGGTVAEVMVNRQERDSLMLDVKVIFLGCGGNGKSTLISVLTTGSTDNGRGSARSRILKYKHEVFSGLTSSISHHMLGFDADGNCTNSFHGHRNDQEYIVDNSSKLVTLIDLGGSEKYPQQVVTALCNQFADYAVIVHDATKSFNKITQLHLSLCKHLHLPIIVVFNKVELASEEQLRRSREQLDFLIREQFTIGVETEEDVVICIRRMKPQEVVPVFYVSCVSKQKLNLLSMFFNLLPVPFDRDYHSEAVFHIEKNLSKDTEDNTIVGGMMLKGTVNTGQWMLLGPDDSGKYSEVQIDCIHCKEIKVLSVKAGHFCSFKFNGSFSVRSGMVLLDSELSPCAAYEFECEFTVTDDVSSIRSMKSTYQPCVHVGMIRQSTRLLQEPITEVRPDESFKLRLQFIYHPVYILPGTTVLIKDTFMTAVGVITEVNYISYEAD